MPIEKLIENAKTIIPRPTSTIGVKNRQSRIRDVFWPRGDEERFDRELVVSRFHFRRIARPLGPAPPFERAALGIRRRGINDLPLTVLKHF